MNSFYTENQGTATYLVYRMSDDETLDPAVLGMLTYNSIKGLSRTHFTQMNADRFIKYNITSRIPLSQYFEGMVSRKQLLSVFLSITDALIEKSDYMIDDDLLVLDREYVFVSVENGNAELICLPVEGRSGNQPARDFFKDLIMNAQFDPKDFSFVPMLLNYLNSAGAFSPEGFRGLLLHLSGQQPAPAAQQASAQTSANQASAQQTSRPAASPKAAPQPNVPQPSVSGQAGKPAHGQPVAQPAPAKADVRQPEPAPASGSKKAESGLGFSIPGASGSAAAPQKNPEAASSDGEKPISLFYLLQHYNSENAEKYKAQKEAKKNQQKSVEKAAGQTSGFAIPGQQPNAPVQQPQPSGNFGGAQASGNLGGAQASGNFGAQPSGNFGGAQASGARYGAGQPVGEPPRQTPIPLAKTGHGGAPVYNVSPVGVAPDDGTVLIGEESGAQAQSVPYIIRKKTGERVNITTFPFRIGRSADFATYVITDNEHIGRAHCHILSHDGKFWLVDDNSKNHTSIDGRQLVGGQENLLAPGQVFRAANEDFEFRV